MAAKPALAELNHWFYAGKYRDVRDAVTDRPLDQKARDFLAHSFLQIGSLIFLGQFREAKIIFERATLKTQPDLLFLCRARFYLGIGCVRRSEYAEAARYFAENVKVQKSKSRLSHDMLFHIYQGRAFLSFYKGHFQKTKSLAEKAFEAAYRADSMYGQALSLDLLGHSLCQTGEVRRGLSELERALKLAKTVGNGGLESAISISLIKYRAQFGVDLESSIDILERSIESLNPQDTYSRSELYLELIRQLILRGRGDQAQKQLETASDLIYRNQNKRQSAIYNLRCSYLLFLQGQAHAALALAQTLRMNLNPKIDTVILKQVEGLEEKIHAHIQKRIEAPRQKADRNRGEDRLGDIIDQIHDDGIDRYHEISSLGLHGLLPRLLQLPVGASGILIGPSRGEMLIVKGAEVTCIERGVTEPIRQLLQLLSAGRFRPKEELIHLIWKYEYNPEMHDRLLHGTIGKLRQLMADNAHWIEWSNEGYRLAPGIQLFQNKQRQMAPEISLPPPIASELNIRQIKILAALKKGLFIGVNDYSKRYKICKMTALRDLSSLERTGHVTKIGKGRATVYGQLDTNMGVL